MKELSTQTKEQIAKALGWQWKVESEPIEPYLKQIETMDRITAFNYFCQWEGLLGDREYLGETWDELGELDPKEGKL